MRLQGALGRRSVQGFIDPGSTHDFIHQHLLKYLTCPIDFSRSLNVTVANDTKEVTHGYISKLQLCVQNYSFHDEFHVMAVTGCEIVLGAQWLRTLGSIVWNFASLTVHFAQDAVVYKLQGFKPRAITLVDSDTKAKLIIHKGHDVLAQLQTDTTQPQNLIPPQIQQLLDTYDELFQPPTQLPPSRICDHKINLIPGTAPISVRPYRYPFFQKAEIERIVCDMLETGFIRPSVSPFSSQVLLVKKKMALGGFVWTIEH